eukprot:GEMP01021692.1.p1 GENE.GEMP01021692.1~~GEMP01021692.1.p1  ORF type:complete len:687 (+),score=175.19 GEMP01021692.1:131-2191(+)
MEQSLQSLQSLQSMKVPELREILRKEGLTTTGRKQELIDRILQRRVARFGPNRDLGEPTLRNQQTGQASQTVRVPTMPIPAVQPAIVQPAHHPGYPACSSQPQMHPAYHAPPPAQPFAHAHPAQHHQAAIPARPVPPVHAAPVLHAVPVPTTVPATAVVPTVQATVAATAVLPTVHATAVPFQGPPMGRAHTDTVRSMPSQATTPSAPAKNTGPLRHASRGVFDFLFSDSESEDIPKVVSTSQAQVTPPVTHVAPQPPLTTPAASHNPQTTSAASHNNQTTLAAPRNNQTTHAVSSSSNAVATAPLMIGFSDDEDECDASPGQDNNRAPPHAPQITHPETVTVQPSRASDYGRNADGVVPHRTPSVTPVKQESQAPVAKCVPDDEGETLPLTIACDYGVDHEKDDRGRSSTAVRTHGNAQEAQDSQGARSMPAPGVIGLAAAQDAIRTTVGYAIENGADVVSRQHHPQVRQVPALKRARKEELQVDATTSRTPAPTSRTPESVPHGVTMKPDPSAVAPENKSLSRAVSSTASCSTAGREAGSRAVGADNPRNGDNGDSAQPNSEQPRPASVVSLPGGWQIHKKFLGNFQSLQQQVRLGMKENESLRTSASCDGGALNTSHSTEPTFGSMGTASSTNSLRSFKAFKRKRQNSHPSQLIRTFIWTEEADTAWGNQILTPDAMDQDDEP